MKEIYFKLHLSVLLAGMTGVFGKLITLNEGLLVWYRLMMATVILFAFFMLTGKLQKISFRDFARIAFVGFLLGMHWVFFYGSIKASNISIGVVCFSLVGFFTSILEPLLLKRRFSIRELFYSIIALIGVMLIFSFDIRYRTGVLLGIVSSALAALFTINTKRISTRYPAKVILPYEMLGGFLVLSCLLPLYLYFFPVETILPDTRDFIYLIIFVVVCTIGLQLLQIQVLRSLSAFTVNLTYNLEPVYSILLAMLFFHEAKELNVAFYAGLSCIILSVILQSKAPKTTHPLNPPKGGL